jgi:hypothetical protein
LEAQYLQQPWPEAVAEWGVMFDGILTILFLNPASTQWDIVTILKAILLDYVLQSAI